MKLDQGKAYLEDYLRQRGLSLRKPFHCMNPDHEDRHPSMCYDSRASRVHCFSCGASYDIFDLVGIDYGLSGIREQYEKVCDLFGLEPVSLEYRKETMPGQNPSTGEPEDRSPLLHEMKRQASEELAYFLSRGISRESCEKYGLFQWEGRAVFPVWEGGKCTGWCARAVDRALQPRYKNSTGALGLWNGDLLRSDGDGQFLFVTEGIVDAVLLEQSGKRAVALCGSQNTGKLLRRCGDSAGTADTWIFVLCGDADDAGRKMNGDLAEGLRKLGIRSLELPLEPEDGDIGELFLKNPRRLISLLAGLDEQARQGGCACYDPAAGTGGLFSATKYAGRAPVAADIEFFFAGKEKQAARGLIPTGFPRLDKLLDGGLHPGLYVIGAISSLGKTSFILQMADYIASHSADILFFSLEQSRRELMAKSLSRTSFLLDRRDRRSAFTARQLLTGNYSDTNDRRRLLADVRILYARGAGSLYIREGIADIGAEEVRAAVREHREATGRTPVVVVDYLQILRPAELRATDKQNTDKAVVELKRISRDFDIPVIAVSSFNRENYRSSVSMEAFKESGAVEYSSDVLLGMQLAGSGSRDFDLNQAKSREPRQIELVILKNRNGIPYAKIGYRYHAKFNFFEEC